MPKEAVQAYFREQLRPLEIIDEREKGHLTLRDKIIFFGKQIEQAKKFVGILNVNAETARDAVAQLREEMHLGNISEELPINYVRAELEAAINEQITELEIQKERIEQGLKDIERGSREMLTALSPGENQLIVGESDTDKTKAYLNSTGVPFEAVEYDRPEHKEDRMPGSLRYLFVLKNPSYGEGTADEVASRETTLKVKAELKAINIESRLREQGAVS